MVNFLAFGSIWLLASLPFHQARQDNVPQAKQEISCYQMNDENRAWKKKLWDGYEVSLGPTPQAADNPDQGCTAAIYNQVGHVVFRTTGFSVAFDENQTGQDFDDDGKSEVVFRTDTGGGMHCCWAYNVISLSPTPHKLFDIDGLPGVVRFEKDNHGKMIIWQRTAGPYGLTTEARVPFAEKVFRVRDGKLADATLEFCSRILSDENEDYRDWGRDLTAENIKKLQAPGGLTNVENEDIISALLSRALQHVFCRQFDAAANDLDVWPEANRAMMKAAFAQSIKQDYPEFAARLISAGGMGSAQPSNSLQKINWLKGLTADETFLAAKLNAAERKQIIDQVEKTSFDVPESWGAELRVRRVSLGEAEGLVIRGTQLLCGGTGNCETWIFRLSHGDWFNLFEQEAPIVSGLGFEPEATQGVKNLLVSSNSSAERERRILFKFDGKFYRQSECYDVSVNGPAAEKVEKVTCK